MIFCVRLGRESRAFGHIYQPGVCISAHSRRSVRGTDQDFGVVGNDIDGHSAIENLVMQSRRWAASVRASCWLRPEIPPSHESACGPPRAPRRHGLSHHPIPQSGHQGRRVEIPYGVHWARMTVQTGIQAIKSPRRGHVVLTRHVFFSRAAKDLERSGQPRLLHVRLQRDRRADSGRADQIVAAAMAVGVAIGRRRLRRLRVVSKTGQAR